MWNGNRKSKAYFVGFNTFFGFQRFLSLENSKVSCFMKISFISVKAMKGAVRCCTYGIGGVISMIYNVFQGLFQLVVREKRARGKSYFSKDAKILVRFVSSGEYNSQVICIKINGHQTLTVKLFPSFNYHIMRRHDVRVGELD